MFSTRHGIATITSLVLALGCSSKSSTSVHDGSTDGRDTGKADLGKGIDTPFADGVSPAGDGARTSDARDAGNADLGAIDVGTRDAVDAKDARDANPASDATSGMDGADVRNNSDTRDGPSVRVDALDAPSNRDGDQPGVDAAVDVYVVVPGTCANPIEIPYYNPHSELSVSTTGAAHILNFPCASNGADLVFKVQATQTELAYADTFGTPWNTALFFSDTCDKPNPPDGTDGAECSDDTCGTSQSQAVAVLRYGWHYLIVSGVNGESGNVTVHFQHAPIGTGPLATLPRGTGTVQGTASVDDYSDMCEAGGPKNSYWWVGCPSYAGGALHASTCAGANWDTVLSLQIPQLGTLSCNDDDPVCGTQSTLDSPIAPGSGLYILTVAAKLMDYYGDYTLTYTRP